MCIDYKRTRVSISKPETRNFLRDLGYSDKQIEEMYNMEVGNTLAVIKQSDTILLDEFSARINSKHGKH